LPDSLVYLDASRLQYADFVRQLPALQHARGLIVDLRQRPAYGMQLALAHWASAPLRGDWLATPVLHAPNFAAATYDSARSTMAAQLPHLATSTVFLIGPDTFSYGETLVELIRHYRLGVLLGQPTGGTNGEMNFVNVGHHYRLSWTGRRVCNRDGRPYQGQGIAPDVAVRPTLATIQRPEDAALQQAIAYLAASPRPGPLAPKATAPATD
jgi:C-terminal processing protease CtpA/Prc